MDINKNLINKEIEIFEREYLEANPHLFSGMSVPYHKINKTNNKYQSNKNKNKNKNKNNNKKISKKRYVKNNKIKKLRRSVRIADKLKNKSE